MENKFENQFLKRLNHVSSLRSSRYIAGECWNIGTLEYWVLGKWEVGLL